jgi:hypothetical protein
MNKGRTSVLPFVFCRMGRGLGKLLKNGEYWMKPETIYCIEWVIA